MAGNPLDYGARGAFRARNRTGQFVQGGYGIEWVGLDMLDTMFEQYGERMQQARVEVGDRLGAMIEDYMKANAPWQDRTGDARKGLKATVVHDATATTIWAGYSHETPYGFFLENYTYKGVSYAIVRPTLEKFANDMGAMIREAM